MKKYLTFVFSIVYLFLTAQKPVEDFNIYKKISVSNNLNTGKLDINIPLFDFNNITLNYRSDYVYPNKIQEPSIVGKNWNINLLGKITFVYEDMTPINSPVGETTAGFHAVNYDYCMLNTPVNQSKANIYTTPNLITSKYMPIKFYFSFLDYSGYIVYDNEGKFIVFCNNQDFKVIYNGPKCINLYNPIQSIPEFILIDNNGTKYYFGGDYDSADIIYEMIKYKYSNVYNNYLNSYYLRKHINYISGLSLKKVEYQNGKIIQAHYKSANRNLLDGFVNGGYYTNQDYNYTFPNNNNLILNNIFLEVLDSSVFDNYFNQFDPTTLNSTEIIENHFLFNKLTILDFVDFSNNERLVFSYSQNNNYLTKPYLDKISLFNTNNNLIKDIQFSYRNYPSVRGAFLDKLKINDEQYSFDYYSNFSSNNIIAGSYTTSSYYSGIGGLLKSVVYPTGAKQEYQYEQNEVSKVYTISNPNQLVDLKWFTDGNRIKTISEYESSNLINTKSYLYKNDNDSSSGILNMYEQSPSNDLMVYFSKVRKMYDDLTRYSTVTEINHGNDSYYYKDKIKYHFTDMTTNPDSLSVKKYSSGGPTFSRPLYIDKSSERGKLHLLQKFNSNNNLVYEESTKYTNFLKDVNPQLLSLSCNGCKISDDRYYVKINESYYAYEPVLPYLPISIIRKERLPNNIEIQTKTYMKYVNSSILWHPFPIEICNAIPIIDYPYFTEEKRTEYRIYNNDILRKNISCITSSCPPDTDLVGGKFSTYKYMYENNIVKPVLEIFNNKNNKVSLVEKVFKKNNSSNNLLELGKIRVSLFDSNFTKDAYNQAQVIEKNIYEIYDNKGNLIQYSTNNNIPITNIYGYGQTLPIAKIEGATYSEVLSALGVQNYTDSQIYIKSNLDVDQVTENSLIEELDNFRKSPLLSNYQTTTYTHNPLIGVTSTTTPSGMREIYRYDTFNRLEKIENINGEILKKFNYNYSKIKYYNSVKYKVFTKSNCPNGYVGSSSSYTVPSNAYSSFISQSDADLLAENDINTNGQNVANSNGTCTQSNCSLLMSLPGGGGVSAYSSYCTVGVGFSSGNNLPWSTTGVKIGKISGNCVPATDKLTSADSNGYWSIEVKANGDIIAKKISNAVANNTNINLNFSYNIN